MMRIVELPRSKSVVARLALMFAVSGGEVPKFSDNDDIEVICNVVNLLKYEVNVQKSGTAARFMIAYCASIDGEHIVDGDEQLRKRPIVAIVDAVRKLGATVEYLNEEGKLPVKLKGCDWGENGKVEIDATESSQCISALMIVGAKKGLTIETIGKRVSWKYVELTKRLMERCGAEVMVDDKSVNVRCKEYQIDKNLCCERDWSAAVLWYGLVSVGEEQSVLLKGLKFHSGQPDERVWEFFTEMGVESIERADGIEIFRSGGQRKYIETDFLGNPDMVMVSVAAMCRLGIKFKLTGLDTLERKESDRGHVLKEEMAKCGYNLGFDGKVMWWNGAKCELVGKCDAHGDHRIAMALMVMGVEFTGRQSINKSYRLYGTEFRGEGE